MGVLKRILRQQSAASRRSFRPLPRPSLHSMAAPLLNATASGGGGSHVEMSSPLIEIAPPRAPSVSNTDLDPEPYQRHENGGRGGGGGGMRQGMLHMTAPLLTKAPTHRKNDKKKEKTPRKNLRKATKNKASSATTEISKKKKKNTKKVGTESSPSEVGSPTVKANTKRPREDSSTTSEPAENASSDSDIFISSCQAKGAGCDVATAAQQIIERIQQSRVRWCDRYPSTALTVRMKQLKDDQRQLEAIDHGDTSMIATVQPILEAARKDHTRILSTLHDVYKKVPEPFDLPYILGLEWTNDDSALTDWRCQMPFTGRSDFLLSVVRTLAYMMNIAFPVHLPRMAMISGSGSGTGKTAALLQLQHFFQVVAKDPIALAQWVAADERHTFFADLFSPAPCEHERREYLLVYCGFGGNLALSREEKRWMELRGNDGAEDVLARRVLGMTAYALANRTRVGVLPSYEQIFGGREIPPHAESFRILKDLLAQNEQQQLQRSQQAVPVSLIIGLDDVDLLNRETVKSRPLLYGEEVKTWQIGLYFLQKLIQWCRDPDVPGLTLPIATGATADFDTKSAYKSKSISAVMDRCDFRSLAREMLSQVEPKDDAFQRRFGIAKDASARWLTAVLWPCVRSLLHLPAWIGGGGAPCAASSATTATESGATAPHTVQKKMNSEEKEEGKQDHSLQMHFTGPKVAKKALPQWRKMYYDYLCDQYVESRNIANNSVCGRWFHFESCGSDYISVFPTGLSSKVLVDAFLAKEPASLHPMISSLPVVARIDREHPFSLFSSATDTSTTRDGRLGSAASNGNNNNNSTAHKQSFLHAAFSMLGCALHIGLRAQSYLCVRGSICGDGTSIAPCVMWVEERLACRSYDKALDKAQCLYYNNHNNNHHNYQNSSNVDDETQHYGLFLTQPNLSAPQPQKEAPTDYSTSHASAPASTMDPAEYASVFPAAVVEKLAEHRPLYIFTEETTTSISNDDNNNDLSSSDTHKNATFFYLMPTSVEKRWVAVVCAAKTFTNQQQQQQQQGDDNAATTTDVAIRIDDQIQLLNTCTRLAQAMSAAGHSLVATRLAFFTNGDGRLEGLSSAGHSDKEQQLEGLSSFKQMSAEEENGKQMAKKKGETEFSAALQRLLDAVPATPTTDESGDVCHGVMGGVEQQDDEGGLFFVLNSNTFQFSPFSNILFATPFRGDADAAHNTAVNASPSTNLCTSRHPYF